MHRHAFGGLGHRERFGNAQRRPHEEPQAPDVTEAEQAVLTLLCEGYSNAEIAEQLVVAESTVKTHVSHLMKKYDVPSRLKLVVAVHKTQGA